MSLIPEITLLADLIEGHLRPKTTPDGKPNPAPTDTTPALENIAPPVDAGTDSDASKPAAPPT